MVYDLSIKRIDSSSKTMILNREKTVMIGSDFQISTFDFNAEDNPTNVDFIFW
jgi:hypothetical protein